MTKAITDASTGAQAQTVEVISSIITPDEFLGILAEEVKEYPLGNGTHAVLRSLSRPDVLKLLREYKDKTDDMPFGAVRMALVSPQLTAEQWAIAEKGKAGPLFRMGKAVMELAGMIDSDEAAGGDGASS